jgi:hypothetical protein
MQTISEVKLTQGERWFAPGIWKIFSRDCKTRMNISNEVFSKPDSESESKSPGKEGTTIRERNAVKIFKTCYSVLTED